MRHIPVLLQEVIEGSNLKAHAVVVDCNLGDGGHSQVVIEKLKGKVSIIGFDLDQDAIDRATLNIFSSAQVKKSGFKKSDLHLFRKNFRFLKEVCEKDAKVEKVDVILFDLGLSSYELQESKRGFSFMVDEPLSMTFGQKEDHMFNAGDIINTWDEENLRTIIESYGEDRFALRIARAIVEARELKPIKTTGELSEIVKNAVPGFAKGGRINPATKTFQALRIAVNDELRALEDALPQAVELLKPQGRLLVISYHSLEDRIVKRYFKSQAEENRISILTKRPITPSEKELAENPRSRSAKLRIIEKI